MGLPYLSGKRVNANPTLTLHNCDMISLLVTLEHLVGLNMPFEDDAESKLNIKDWMQTTVGYKFTADYGRRARVVIYWEYPGPP